MQRTAMAILGHEADARDAVAESLAAIWRELPRLRDPLAFDAWIDSDPRPCLPPPVARTRPSAGSGADDRGGRGRTRRSGHRRTRRRRCRADGARGGVRAARRGRPDDPGPAPPRRPRAGRDRRGARDPGRHREVAVVRRAPRPGARAGARAMNQRPPLDDDAIRAMLIERADRASAPRLDVSSIVASTGSRTVRNRPFGQPVRVLAGAGGVAAILALAVLVGGPLPTPPPASAVPSSLSSALASTRIATPKSIPVDGPLSIATVKDLLARGGPSIGGRIVTVRGSLGTIIPSCVAEAPTCPSPKWLLSDGNGNIEVSGPASVGVTSLAEEVPNLGGPLAAWSHRRPIRPRPRRRGPTRPRRCAPKHRRTGRDRPIRRGRGNIGRDRWMARR